MKTTTHELKDVEISPFTIGDITFKGVNVSDFIEKYMEYYEVPIAKESANQSKVKVFKKRNVGFSAPCPIKLVKPNE